jgi:hypothetical protein
MNSVTMYLIDFIKYHVNADILHDVFGPKHTMDVTLEQNILDIVINGRVLQDCNVLTGTEVVIDISNCNRNIADNGIVIYVGFGPTQGRRISSVLAVSYMMATTYGGGAGIASALAPDPAMCTSRVYLVGPNTILVNGVNFIAYTHLRCMLELDEGFAGISERLKLTLANLTLLATKAFIYNYMYLRIGNAVNMYGKDIARYNEIIASYADASTMYFDMLKTQWRPAYVSTDRVTANRLIRMQLGGLP